MIGICEFCEREQKLTEHHLIPRAVHSKKKFLKRFGKEEMKSRTVDLCKLCHKGVHRLFSEKELAEEYKDKQGYSSK
jgi:hypothetical protein